MAKAGSALGPVAVGAGRVLGAAIVLLLAWRIVTPSARVPRDKWLACLVVGLVANGYPYVVQPYLISTGLAIGGGGGHSFFGMMVAFTPLLTILASAPMLGIWPTARQLVGVLVGLGFMGLLMSDGIDRGITPVMLLMAFSIPLSYSLANTYLRRSLSEVPATALTASMLVAPALVLTPFALSNNLLAPLHLAGPANPTDWPSSLAAVAVLGILGTGVTMWLFVRLVQQQGPLFAGMVTYVVPVVAMLWGIVDGEKVSTPQVVAIAGVLSMVALVQYGAAQRKPAVVPTVDTTAAPREV